MNDNQLTFVGNLVGDPEMRFLPSGRAMANFSLAHTTRRPDDKGVWKDVNTTFARFTAWGDIAEHLAVTAFKGDRIMVIGHLRQNRWETAEGDKRSQLEVEVDDVGPSLRWATAEITKVDSTRSDNGSGPRAEDEAAVEARIAAEAEANEDF